MKFWAKVNLNGMEEGKTLLEGFFEDFNPQSSLKIKGGEAELEVIFDEFPRNIIKAISECTDFEFDYHPEPNAVLKREEVLSTDFAKSEEISEKTEKEIISEKTLKSEEQIQNESTEIDEILSEEESNSEKTVSKEESNPEQMISDEKSGAEDNRIASVEEKHQSEEKGTKSKKRNRKNLNLESEELQEIAKKSTSYDDFVRLVTEWINFSRRNDKFIHIVQTATKLDEFTWDDLEAKLSLKGISINISDRNLMSKVVTEKLKGSKNPLRILELVKAITLYKNYEFANQMVNSENTNVKEKHPAYSIFENIFNEVDKATPIETRIRKVLVAMGANAFGEDSFEKICKDLSEMMLMKDIDVEKSISDNEERMRIFTLVNSFVSKAGGSRIKVVDFIKVLQQGILTEDEIKNVANS